MRDRRIDALSLTAAAMACSGLLAACGSAAKTGTTGTRSIASGGGAKTGTAAGGSSLKVTGTPRFASPSSSDPIRSGTVQIAYRNITISPDTLRMKVGSTVRWTDQDPVQHNVTSVSGPQRFASQRIGEGQSFAVKLTRTGTIHYECTIHPATMNGTIEVVK
jgi:plastocyanin